MCIQAIGKKVPLYITRHTFARLIVLDGAPANVAKNLLGHASLAMTTRHTRIKNEQTQLVASKLSAALTGRKLDAKP